MEEELLGLQTQVSYQDDALQQLNDVVARQQQDIERMSVEIRWLKGQIERLVSGGQETTDEPPPHY